MKKLSLMSAMLFLVAAVVVLQRPAAQVQVDYVPTAQLCADNSTVLCSKLPAYIGNDELLKGKLGYAGLFRAYPTEPNNDLETPFDNMAWQMFVALNWGASAVNQPPAQGLNGTGARVFQKYRKVSQLFGNSPVTACKQTNLPMYYIGSSGGGKPWPNNEEYFQASTNLPLIDINGNWTIYERRVNDVEAQYLLAPNGQKDQTLTTKDGQTNFIKSNSTRGVQFPASATTQIGAVGSIEIKTAWRIIDPSRGDDPSRYFTQRAYIAVPRDLVRGGGRDICSRVTLGLVGMHIVQRNPVDPVNPKLLPQWIWATFEHKDNAPTAQVPCTVKDGCSPTSNWIGQPSCGGAKLDPSVRRYSYYNKNSTVTGTNIRPKGTGSSPLIFPWNQTQPYALGSTTPATAMPQATRCWEIYKTTDQLNTQWQSALAKVNSPFQYYMLIGTQWGSIVEPPPNNVLPLTAVPTMLSNMTLETYIQNFTTATPGQGGPGSCVDCHKFATMGVGNPKPSADFSFLLGLVDPPTARSKIETPRQ